MNRPLLLLLLGGLCSTAPSPVLSQPSPRPVSDRAARSEPTAAETVKAALAYAALNPERIESLRSRAEWKSLVPVLGVKAGLSNSTIALTKFTQAFSATEPAETEDAKGDALEVEVSGQWNLPGLVYNPEVLDVNALVDQQRELVQVVLEAWAARRRLVLEGQYGAPPDATTRARREVELERMTAFLDALTGDTFSRRARRATADDE
jgi:hypothetical protein